MQAIVSVLNRVLVRSFYERHATLLFLVFYLMLGVVESSQIVTYHKALITGTLTSPWILLLVVFVWLLYMFKSILFLEQTLAKSENAFLLLINRLAPARQFYLLVYVLIITDLPVLVYSAVMILMAISLKTWLAGGVVILVHISLLSLGAMRLRHVLNTSTAIQLPIPKFNRTFPLPALAFPFAFLADQHKLMMLLTKLFSVLCVIGFLQIPLDRYDPRTAFLGLLIGLSGHSVIIMEWFRFSETQLRFTKGLPLSLTHQFLNWVAAYGLLMIPEMVVLARHGLHINDITLALGLCISFLILLHTTGYSHGMDADRLQKQMLFLFLTSFMLALFKLALPLAGIGLVIAYWRFRKGYRQYEVGVNNPG